ncbi:MAG TPA: multicopper oxidase domain-containing protein [Gemmatimonadaceae bacterium]|nr:multicopper oxidase domain-containing protein [Gemmatimonadaceae bacterium]
MTTGTSLTALKRLVVVPLLFAASPVSPYATASRLRRAELPAPTALANDNRVPAGRRVGDTLVLSLEITRATWRPRGADDPGIDVATFAEAGKVPRVPGPLIRVPTGTLVRATISNRIGKRVVVRGLRDRGDPSDSIVLAPDSTASHAFRAVTPGTYLYIGRTTSRAGEFGRGEDEALSGAIVVDPRDQPPHPAERIIVMTAWDDTAHDSRYPAGYAQVFAINGLSWPNTERLTYTLGDTVRWRVLNATSHFHPMHLHGFFFAVLSQGTSARDTLYAPGDERAEVTHAMRAGTSISLRWVADRPGNWLFHCHAINHIDTALRLDEVEHPGHAMSHARVDDVMSGLVMALTVRPRANIQAADPPGAPRRKLRVSITEGPADSVGRRPLSYVLQQGSVPPRADSVRRPGSTLVLHEGEPTQITVLNRSSHATTVHWHGLELESYYDGIAGWSGADSRTAPIVAPGDSFVVRITPPRAGTFIYHAHSDERAQISNGLYGAFFVLPRGQRELAPNERVVIISERGIELPDVETAATGLAIDDALPTRLRIVGISVGEPMALRLARDSTPVSWLVVAKDGAELPARQRRVTGELTFGAGETMDIELPATLPAGTALELRYPGSPSWPTVRVPITVRGNATHAKESSTP